MKFPIVLQKKGERAWVTFIKRKTKLNNNFVGFFSGPTGSGKSYCCLSMAEQIDPTFTIDRVCFDAEKVVRLIREGNLKTGQVLVWEETGVGLNNKAWQSVTNKVINFLFQTFRHRRLVLLLNAPYIKYIDSSTRALIDAQFQTETIIRSKNQVRVIPKALLYEEWKDKYYRVFLKVITKKGVRKQKRLFVPKPSKHLIEEYEKKKMEFTDRLYKEIERDIENSKPKEKKKNELTKIQTEILEMLKQGMNLNEIGKERNRDPRVVRVTMNLIRGKGYEFKPQYKEGKIAKYLVFDPEGKDISSYITDDDPIY